MQSSQVFSIGIYHSLNSIEILAALFEKKNKLLLLERPFEFPSVSRYEGMVFFKDTTSLSLRQISAMLKVLFPGTNSVYLPSSSPIGIRHELPRRPSGQPFQFIERHQCIRTILITQLVGVHRVFVHVGIARGVERVGNRACTWKRFAGGKWRKVAVRIGTVRQ